MTICRIPIFRTLPPTGEFWALYVGDESAGRYLLQGLLLHALYGGVAGTLFAPLFGFLVKTLCSEYEPGEKSTAKSRTSGHPKLSNSPILEINLSESRLGSTRGGSQVSGAKDFKPGFS